MGTPKHACCKRRTVIRKSGHRRQRACNLLGNLNLEGLVYSRFDLKFVIKLTAWGFSRNVMVKCPMEGRTGEESGDRQHRTGWRLEKNLDGRWDETRMPLERAPVSHSMYMARKLCA